ncbi:aldolase/citrate lyase family protein [Nocardioides sp. AN3]
MGSPAAPKMPGGELAELSARLDHLLADVRARPRPRRLVRQPVHTVYVPADQVAPGLPAAWGRAALELADQHLPDDRALAAVLGRGSDTLAGLLTKVRDKLAREPVEDLRIDLEDGYGHRSDIEEDAHVRAAAAMLADDLHRGSAPARHGIRFKCLDSETRERGLRSVALFVAELSSRGAVTPGLVLTLPKVTSVCEVQAMVQICEHLERRHALAAGSLRFELQIELPEAIVDDDGRHPAGAMARAGDGRVVGLHYGTYDYSAACGVAGPFQAADHPVADYAKAVLLAGVAGTGVDVVDGSTNRLPVGRPDQVRRGWAEHARLVRRALEGGIYQGWDLHPGQLVTRFAATFAFYLAAVDPVIDRLSGVGGDHIDEPATRAAMRDFIDRAIDCGAVDEGRAVPL